MTRISAFELKSTSPPHPAFLCSLGLPTGCVCSVLRVSRSVIRAGFGAVWVFPRAPRLSSLWWGRPCSFVWAALCSLRDGTLFPQRSSHVWAWGSTTRSSKSQSRRPSSRTSLGSSCSPSAAFGLFLPSARSPVSGTRSSARKWHFTSTSTSASFSSPSPSAVPPAVVVCWLTCPIILGCS